MADTTGNDPKAGKPTETKSGPVKPPVLDLKANAKPEAKPEVKEAAKPAEKPADKPATSFAPKPAEEKPAPFPIAATLAGGVLGLAAAYALAFAGLWPAPAAPATAADPRIAGLASAVPELETVTQTTQSELATLNQRIAALEEAAPVATGETAAPVDLGPIESQVASLSERIDTLAAAPADSAGLDTLRSDLTSIGTRIDELAARVGTAEAGLRTLDTSVSQTSAALATQPSDIGAVLQLPLILSGLETAFGTGRPYATELAALRAASPEATIPTAIANKADSGLARPDVIASRFAEVLPAMLGGKPADPQAQWQDGALDWFRSAIALRPTGEIAGDTPDAVMSRLEGAVARRDFAAAEVLLADLPEPMLAAGGDVPTLIAEQASAARFLDDLRASALSGGVTP
ncbi:MAG: hypothetical protein P0Y65_19190 [Candidatus Devosia phytovorans]|uniref:Inner membrane protein n=1 Tax=Candidatus Devosia phytovorans TaxID=3121372 RepID=A0AAJ5VVN9_9HYPH|nr:hypothetical protein [Devosia sp.]WEK04278.1 MAG: hypothetical protein P0Y65_19190 [Devosia sp.]